MQATTSLTPLPLVARRMEVLADDMQRAAASVPYVRDEDEARAAAEALTDLLGQAAVVADRLSSRLNRYARANSDATQARRTRGLARDLDNLAGVIAALADDVQASSAATG
jgi:hypothetical protein